jgi:poly(3-hydroxybutyrate) depolymerase
VSSLRSTLFVAAIVVLAQGAGAGPKVSPSVAPLALGDDARAALDAAARGPATTVRLAPSPSGRLGAWLLAGPYRSATYDLKTKPAGAEALEKAPPEVDEATIAPFARREWGPPRSATTAAAATTTRSGPRVTPAWLVGSSGDGPIDVKSALKATENDTIAYAAGTLHVERAGRLYLLVGTDDGVRVLVDGRPVFTRDESRPERDDDDLVPLDLDAGDHAIVLKLHQRDASWAMHVRLVDGDLAPPVGAYLALPGTVADDARELATKMSWVSVDRGADATGYKPRLTVRFPEGAPRGVPLRVQAKLTRSGGAPFFQIDAGEVPLGASGVGELVAALPPIAGSDLPGVEDVDWTYEIDVAGRTIKSAFFPRRATREALAAADRALAANADESVAFLRDRLAQLVSRGDADLDAQRVEARDLADAARAIERNDAPFEQKTGPLRRAYRSPVDGELHELGLYVPPSYRAGTKRRWPLVVALHGLNGHPMAMLRWFFGGDEPKKDQEWEDRHVGPLPPLDAFVVTPSGHGNTMYRDLGEDDVMRALDWVTSRYPIDPARVTVTGPSMGGIGSAAVAFRYPDRFAAAAPLCGYHSYFVRRDFIGRPIRPWERVLAEERSNVFWADNGARTPLFIVHGTRDLPEANSGVLIERYEALRYPLVHEHPDLGHNVWQPTYADLRGAKWLLPHRRDLHPPQVKFRTLRLRSANDAWVHVRELERPDAWGEIDARVRTRTRIDVRTKGIAELALDRDDKLVDAGKALTVVVDGTSIDVDDAEPPIVHKEDGTWKKGPATHDTAWKRGEITGPFRDAFRAPLLFVYGASDPAQTRANEEVARAFATIRFGVSVRYPMMSDAEFFERGEALANERALFLVGNAASNRVVRALEGELPIRIEGGDIVLGAERVTGRQVGAAFIRPNPKRPDRYVVVVEGVDALGTWRALSLPDLMPDFVVYDEALAPARGQMLLSAATVRAAGFFRNDWSLPPTFADPLATTARPAAKSEADATPYLP